MIHQIQFIIIMSFRKSHLEGFVCWVRKNNKVTIIWFNLLLANKLTDDNIINKKAISGTRITSRMDKIIGSSSNA